MSPSHNILDLGLSDFNETWELQKKLQRSSKSNESKKTWNSSNY